MCARLFIITSLLLFTAPALAAEKVGNLYKWTDDEGRVHYTDTPPPEAANEEREVLNERGLTIEVLPAEKTPEQLAAEQRARELAAKQAALAAEQAKRDHALMATYTEVSEIERARDNRLLAVEAKIRVASGSIENLEARIVKLEKQAARFENDKAVPPYIANQLNDARSQLLENQRYLMARRTEQEEIRAEYAEKISRFKALKAEE
ncbi:MAG TPA: DUF4124 domain-containing protein [Gammaproteobacteria bacterium]|nr:DUF4124 domain-containing protein [Gammaproteobacteria bacterium]